MRLGELLVAAGLISEDKVRLGLEEQRRNNLFLGEALVNLGYVSEEAIAQAIIQHFNLPFISATQFSIPSEVFNLFPARMYHEYQFIAVEQIDQVIVIVAAGPINQDMMEELERVSDCRIYQYVSTWQDIRAAIEKNSKDIGGEAQVELTGLGSMLLEMPKFEKPNQSGAAKISSSNLTGVSMASAPTQSAPRTVSIRLPAASQKIAMSQANMSALLSPLGMSIKPSSNSPISVKPPTARLTAFLKVTPGSTGAKSGQFKALNISSAPNVSPTDVVPIAPTDIAAVPPPNFNGNPAPSAADEKKSDPAKKTVPSFLTVQKP